MEKNLLVKKIDKTVANVALTIAKASANSTCLFWNHQPKLPDKVKKLRNF